MAQKHLFLPKLLDTANVAEPKQHGHWEAQDKRIIRAISDGIEVASEASDRGVSSVPDAYARPLTFQSALDSAGHPLRERVTQEWRGLLSLLALHRIKPDLNKVSFTPVRFNQGRFARALVNLAPRPVRLERAPAPTYAWTDFLLIKFDGVTLGAFSPSTLVFTSADYHQKLRDKPFPLKDAEGYLCPPPASNREDLESVGEWVSWLKKEFAELANSTEGPGEEDAVRVLNGQFEAWQKSIRRDLGKNDSEAIDALEFEVAREPIGVNDADFLGQRAIYQLLLRPLQRDKNAAAGNVSDYALEIAAERLPAGLQHVVVIEANLLSQNLKLWPGIKPAELGPDPIRSLFREASGTRINNSDIGKEGGLWVRPELYFLTPTLTKAVGAGQFLNGPEARANGGTGRYLLPLRKEILQFFTVDDITERLRPTYTEEHDRVVFSIRLPLRGGRGIEIKKAYSAKGAVQAAGEGVLIEREIPVLELFPNYMGEFWARYYLLFSDTERLAAKPVHYGTPHFYLADRVQRLDSSTEHLKAELTRISGVDCFPEGIELSERGGAPIGLVLVEKDRDMMQRAFLGTAIVGVDFGTSNTNVFTLREDQAEPMTLRFKTDYLRGLLAADPEARKTFAQAFFVPVEDVVLPTPTALREYNPGVRKDLLLDYFLYFPDRPRYPDNVLVDLKWEEESTSNLNNYLEALVFVIMVELVRQRVGRIEFRCTYPKSFSTTRASDYRSKWASTLQGLLARDGRPEALADGQRLLYGLESAWRDEPGDFVSLQTSSGVLAIRQEPKFATEGIAAGEFFSSEKTVKLSTDRANKAGGSICIDVGGGTTDYSIWFDNEIKYDASVLLAGRQIAEVMARNSRIGDHLLSAEANAALREARGPKFASRMNYILRREHTEISANLARVSNLRDIVQLRRVLVVEFGALAFYAGHLALALDRFLHRKFGLSVSSAGLSLHWGGNASKMLDWIDHGKFKADGIAAQFLNNLFACVVMGEVAPEDERFNLDPQFLHQKQSAGQKNEAAGGIVVIDNMDRAGGSAAAKPAGAGGFVFGAQKAANTVMEGVVMGEAITLGGEHLLPYQLLEKPNEALFRDHTTLYTDSTQTQLDYFLEILNQVGQNNGFIPPGEQITLSPQERMSIRNNLRNDFARLASQEPRQRNIEPVFIMEVRYLLNIMLEKML